jgi:aldehyde dehydrogenase (NAD+)
MEYQHFIDGTWTPGESGEMMDVINPSNREVVARVPRGTKADVDKALESARRTFESGVWSGKTIEERSAVLMRAVALLLANKDRLAYLEALTSGSTIRRTSTVDIGTVAVRSC